MKKKEAGIWLILSLILFIGMYLSYGLQFGGDSRQYIDMHINREPIYPLFLAFFRGIFGGNYLQVVVVVQVILMSIIVTFFLMKISHIFHLNLFFRGVAYGIIIAPHIFTPIFSQSHLVITNGIISEALAIPAFLLFIIEILQYIFYRKTKYSTIALLIAFIISLIRGQMMPTILIWAVVAVACNLGNICKTHKKTDTVNHKKRYIFQFAKKCLIIAACVIVAFTARSVTVRTYNYFVHGYYINNTYGSVNFVAQVLYVADKEDAMYINDERARHVYNAIYEKLDEKQANYKYTEGMSLIEKAYYLEDKHDYIKFDVVEPLTRQYLRDIGIEGDEHYIDQNIEIDRIAREITKSLLPHHFGKWVMNYISISIIGLVRCNTYDKGILIWYAYVMYLLAISLSIYMYVRNRQSKAVRFVWLSLLAIMANVYATSLTIMCLSRYMIYEFSVFYMALLCLVNEMLELKKELKE